MARVRACMEIEKQKLWTLFDTGSRNSYITSSALKKIGVTPQKAKKPSRVALGGKTYTLRFYITTSVYIKKKHMLITFFVIDDVGKDEDGKEIEAIVGALAMQNWGIRPLSDKEKLDLSLYPKEFIEF